MKKTTRFLALLLVAVMMFSFSLGTLTSCTGDGTPDSGDNNDGGNGNTPGGDSGSNVPPAGKINYTVNVKTAGGMPLEGVTVNVFTDATCEDLVNYGSTDKNGSVVISMKQQDGYTVKLSSVPAGYSVLDKYTFVGSTLDIILSSSIISNTSLSGVSYKLGSIMRDFTVTTIGDNPKTVSLSQLLAEKDAVVLNFWYINCSWCKEEFPYMQAAYEEFSDDIAIVALNPYTSDSAEQIKYFALEYGLTFDVSRDVGLASAFGVTSYPTTVVIDRYGMVSLIVNGAITGQKYFTKIFEHFSADNYQQKLLSSYEDLAPQQKPDITMPDSDTVGGVINSGNINVTYYPETNSKDAEYSWPFIITDKDGVACIKPSNSAMDTSFSTMHADVVLKAGEAFGFDYFASSELNSDVLFVLVDGVDVNTISGVNNEWKRCYSFVATEDGTYKITFIYNKDSDTDTADDAVYLKNMHVVSSDEINTPTYIPRLCATKPFANGDGYEKYSSVVLGADGYYHVGDENGPLLLADLMNYTLFSDKNTVFTFIDNALATGSALAAYYDKLVVYCNYGANSQIYGLVTVNEELASLLKTLVNIVGLDKENENLWLQLCTYYDAYGTDGAQLSDPIAGLAPHSAYDTVINGEVGLDEYPNKVYYDRVLMPRGLWYELKPTVSGVYKISSNFVSNSNDTFLEGWIFYEDGTLALQYDRCDRILAADQDENVYIYAYLEAGKSYYIDIAFNDMYYVGGFGFKIEHLGESYNYFRALSPGAAFTTTTDESGNMTSTIIAGGVKVVLNKEDGYYYNVLADGTMGTSRIYADFTMFTAIFGEKALYQIIDQGGFDFSKSEEDHAALYYYENYTEAQLKELWGAQYNELYAEYQMDDIKHGVFHGNGKDMTALARSYYEQIITEGDDINVKGCVEVNEELAQLLQQLMDKYTFANVENSWVKLCYFYDVIDANWQWIPNA
jgi:peroxiredoxin